VRWGGVYRDFFVCLYDMINVRVVSYNMTERVRGLSTRGYVQKFTYGTVSALIQLNTT